MNQFQKAYQPRMLFMDKWWNYGTKLKKGMDENYIVEKLSVLDFPKCEIRYDYLIH